MTTLCPARPACRPGGPVPYRRAVPVLLLLASLCVAGPSARAQTPDPAAKPSLSVEFMKDSYASGEPVEFRVWIENPAQTHALYRFPSGYIADYEIDGAYRWSAGKAFTQATVSLELAPGERRVLHAFSHRPDDFPLGAGAHRLTVSMVGHAETTVRFLVDANAVQSPFVLTPEIVPASSPLGAPVEFRLTVTNAGDVPATFGVDGCPVLYAIDDVYRPQWGCAEFWREITLEPGASISFGPEDDPRLTHEPSDFPLGPGAHTVTLAVPSVGRAAAMLSVGAPAPGFAYLSGQVLGRQSWAAASVDLRLVPTADANGVSGGIAREALASQSGPEGFFFFGDVAPGDYRLLASTPTGVTWYPGVGDSGAAAVLTLVGGRYRGDIKFPLVEDPPPGPRITGVVRELTTDGRRPLARAKVVAIPIMPDWRHDETGSGDPAAGFPPRIYEAVTDADGAYALDLPFGEYRLLAGRPGTHAYRYWPNADRWTDAGAIGVWGPDGPKPSSADAYDFGLPAAPASRTLRVRGIVLKDEPLFSFPGPLEGATVAAFAVLGGAEPAAARTVSGFEGDFVFALDATTPYWLGANAVGHVPQYFFLKDDPSGAEPLDPDPATQIQTPRFMLRPVWPPPHQAVLEGVVRFAAPNGGLVGLAEAFVAAVPAQAVFEDSIGPDGDVVPPAEEWPRTYMARTDGEGRFLLEVPSGSYRLFAAKDGFRYQYSNRVDRWIEAEVVEARAVPANTDPSVRFYEFELNPAPRDWAGIEGRVWDDNPQLGRPPVPIEGAMVRAVPLAPFGPEILLGATTDATGGYTMRVPGDVPYFVRAEAEGFRAEWYPGQVSSVGAEGVDVAPAQITTAVDFGLQPADLPPPWSMLRGIVLEGGDQAAEMPIGGAYVLAIPASAAVTDTVPPWEEGQTFPGDPTLPGPDGAYFAFTADDGTFQMEVPAGLYRVVAGTESGFLYEYWEHASRWNDAALVNAWDFYFPPPGVPEPSLRFRLEPAASQENAVFRGRVLAFDPVTDGPPLPRPGAVVTALPVTPFGPRVVFRAETDENGFYELPVLPRAPYRLIAEADGYQPQYFEQKSWLGEADGVDARPGETMDGLDFVLQPDFGGNAGAVEGRVFVKDDATRCANGERCLVPAVGALVRVEAAYPTFAPYFKETRTDRSGTFRVDDLAAAPDGSLSYYVSVRRDGEEPLFYPYGVPFEQAEPLPLYPGDVVDAGQLVLPGSSGHTGFHGGRILGAEGAGIAGALVRAFLDPDDPFGTIVVARTDARGEFHLSGLPADARFVLSAEAEGYVPAYYPGVHRWRAALRITPGGPAIRVAPLEMSLQPAVDGGPYIQAGRVLLSESDVDSAVVPLAAGPRFRALQYHARNIPDAFFYLGNPMAAGPIEIPLAGGSTGSNGTVVLTGLPEGAYVAYADRPGYETAYYAVAPDAPPIPIFLNPNTPGVLADIRMRPAARAGEGDAAGAPMLTDVLNAPNPFRPATVIRFQLHADEPVSVQVFDFRGRLIRTLADGALMTEGPQAMAWDGTDEAGRPVSAGVYFYRIQAGAQAVSQKMVLMPR